MGNIPEKVAFTLSDLKSKHEHYVEVKRIRNSYCVFQSISKYDKERGRSRKITNYMGRILENGTFVPAVHRSGKATAELGKKLEDEKLEKEIERKILTALSMNARIDMPHLSKIIGMGEDIVRNRVEKLKQRYGITSTAYVDTTKLGYFTFATFIKFENKIPNLSELRTTLENHPRILLAMSTKGEYDLIIFSLAENNDTISDFTWHLKKDSILSTYNAKWYTTPFDINYGVIPLREKNFDLLQEKVWSRTKERPRPLPTELTQREFNVLKELAMDGFKKFIDIDRKYRYEAGTSYYTHLKLREKDIIKRITINIKGLLIRYCGILIAEITNGKEFNETRQNVLLEIIKDTDHKINKYVLVGDIEMPKSGMFIMPVFQEDELMQTQEEIQNKIKGIEVKTLISTNMIIGNLCYTKFDNNDESCKQYKLLTKEYKILPEKELVNYFDRIYNKKSKVLEWIEIPKA